MEGSGCFPFANPAQAAAGGVLEASAIVDWDGDDTHSRVVDMAVDCFLIFIFANSPLPGSSQPYRGYCLGDMYGWEEGATTYALIHTQAAGTNVYFQGKMSGADATKIKLGSTGTSATGSNKSGRSYRAVGFRFAA